MDSLIDIFSKLAPVTTSEQKVGGGKKRTNKTRKLEMLNNKYTVEQLRKYAVLKKIKNFKKVNGKKVYLPKASLLKKIVNYKYEKK